MMPVSLFRVSVRMIRKKCRKRIWYPYLKHSVYGHAHSACKVNITSDLYYMTQLRCLRGFAILVVMSYDKIVAINGRIATIDLQPSGPDNSTCISLQFYKLNTLEDGLSTSGLPVTCNIAQQPFHQLVFCCCAEAVESKTGLYRYFILCGPARLRSETRSLWLYAVDNREITLYREFRLPADRKSCLSDLTFQILDGPTVCFVVQSDVYVATSSGDVQIYRTVVDGVFQYLTGRIHDEHLLVVGLAAHGWRKSEKDQSANQSALLSMYINTSKHLFNCASDTLVPDVYIGLLSSWQF